MPHSSKAWKVAIRVSSFISWSWSMLQCRFSERQFKETIANHGHLEKKNTLGVGLNDKDKHEITSRGQAQGKRKLQRLKTVLTTFQELQQVNSLAVMKSSGHWLVCPPVHSRCFAFSAWHIQNCFSQAFLPAYSQVGSDNGRHERRTGGWQECLASPLVASQQGLATLTAFSYYPSSGDTDSSLLSHFSLYKMPLTAALTGVAKPWDSSLSHCSAPQLFYYLHGQIPWVNFLCAIRFQVISVSPVLEKILETYTNINTNSNLKVIEYL